MPVKPARIPSPVKDQGRHYRPLRTICNQQKQGVARLKSADSHSNQPKYTPSCRSRARHGNLAAHTRHCRCTGADQCLACSVMDSARLSTNDGDVQAHPQNGTCPGRLRHGSNRQSMLALRRCDRQHRGAHCRGATGTEPSGTCLLSRTSRKSCTQDARGFATRNPQRAC